MKDAVFQESLGGDKLKQAIRNLQDSENAVNNVARKIKLETDKVMQTIQRLGNQR